MRSLSPELSLSVQIDAMIAVPALQRATQAIQTGTPGCAYIELLYVAFFTLDHCRILIREGKLPLEAGALFLRGLEERMRPFPCSARLLKADLLRMGALPLPAGPPAPENAASPPCAWNELFLSIDALTGPALLSWMEQQGVALFLAEDNAGATDFSSYELRP